jgi:predicted ATPase
MTTKPQLTIEIENFRGIQRARLDLSKGVNVLIGPNGSGKTSILAAAKFLRDVVTDGAALAMARSGGAARNYHRGQREISFRTTMNYGTRLLRRRKVPFVLHWEISIAQAGAEQISSIVYEAIRVQTDFEKPTTAFSLEIVRSDLNDPKTQVTRPSRHFGTDIVRPVFPRTGRARKEELFESLGARLRDILKAAKGQTDRSIVVASSQLDTALSRLVETISSANEYNFLPEVARQATDQLPAAQMSSSGAGLSEVVHALKNRQFDRLQATELPYGWGWNRGYVQRHFRQAQYWAYYQGFRAGYFRSRTQDGLPHALERIQSELAQAVRPIESIDTKIDPSNGRRFVVFKAGKHTFRPEEVSDGTIKWLCFLVSVFVPHSSIYMIEEPENFLHPWMQQRLIEIMRAESKRTDQIFLLTTHSATVLNAARVEEITVVQQRDGKTLVSHIEDRELVSNSLAKSGFGLGDLWVSGGIGAVPNA